MIDARACTAPPGYVLMHLDCQFRLHCITLAIENKLRSATAATSHSRSKMTCTLGRQHSSLRDLLVLNCAQAFDCPAYQALKVQLYTAVLVDPSLEATLWYHMVRSGFHTSDSKPPPQPTSRTAKPSNGRGTCSCSLCKAVRPSRIQ